MNDRVFNELAIVLPSLDPDKKFAGVIDDLIFAGFKNIVIVDDGSDSNHKQPFEYAKTFEQCRVLVHEINMGKGRALKDAFKYVYNCLPNIQGVITIDGDGQHLLEDIVKCGEVLLDNQDKIILGSRNFDAEGVPSRSVAGNKFTSKMFKLLFGIQINDTQTGLRAIPRQYLDKFSDIEGERFEYETNMLLYMKKAGIDFIEQPIATVYDPDDYSSHYNAVKDSARVGKIMLKYIVSGSGFKYAVSSVLSVLLDNGIFFMLGLAFGIDKQLIIQPVSTFLSSIFNFHMNKYFAFNKKGNYFKELGQYYMVFVPRTLISILATHFVISIGNVASASVGTAFKLLVDMILFVAVYFIQKKWIFK